jgi:hypothetical protein
VVGVRPSRAESIDVSGARGGFAMSAPSGRVAQLVVRRVDLGHRPVGAPLDVRIAAGDVGMVLAG